MHLYPATGRTGWHPLPHVDMALGHGNIGGFLAGLLLFNAFDPVAPQPRFDPRRSR